MIRISLCVFLPFGDGLIKDGGVTVGHTTLLAFLPWGVEVNMLLREVVGQLAEKNSLTAYG